jgi:DNA-binding transcriptional LysR family regulator
MLDLSLDHLHVLVAVADAGSISGAARKLRRAQSSVSYAIANLEQKLDVVLLDREGYRARFTPQGEAILGEARGLLAGVDRLSVLASRLENRKVEPRLRVAFDSLLSVDRLVSVLASFSARFSATQLVLRAESPHSARRMLIAGECDLALHAELEPAAAGLVSEPLGSLRLVHVAAPSHPLAALAGTVPRAVLRQHVQLVLSERDPEGFRARDLGVTGGLTWRFMDMSVRHAALRAGIGYGSMPRWSVEDDLREGALVELRTEIELPPPIAVVATYQGPRVLGPAAQWLVRAVRGALDPARDEEKSPRPARSAPRSRRRRG